MTWPIRYRISAKSPPVCRWMLTEVTKKRRSRLGTRLHMLFSASSRAMPKLCSS